MDSQNNSKKLGRREIIYRGSLIGLLITVPSLTAFFLVWFFTEELFTSAIIGAVIHFCAMGFSWKVAKKFFVKKSM
ncbi:MAG: hypothetical protein GWN01_00555 [Nitrosopumilaceae archaeon]|nr:hypothetical protein [Nitrosopumilaceae archaeon]NIT99471.1 hypothetical protein [Nitrosopumilaceae archaeon]NIU85830.1 hypothetical protein [Nitrosopumilaceae archaeon]NIV64687.1 hypothetical protein [Nitrosopumilaceae archaeon]NIX60074.1 hypothetical protein [Nitrosopumilaceae archaeon]